MVIAAALVLELASTPAAPPASANVYVDPRLSSCKGGATFSCTIVLNAHQGGLTASVVKSVEINGTNTQPNVTGRGGSVTIVVSLPSISMQRGLADVGPSQRPPSVGSVIIDLSDGTAVSVLLGPGGVLQ